MGVYHFILFNQPVILDEPLQKPSVRWCPHNTESIKSIQYSIVKLVSAAFNLVTVNRENEGWFLQRTVNNGGWVVKRTRIFVSDRLIFCNVTKSEIIALFSNASNVLFV